MRRVEKLLLAAVVGVFFGAGLVACGDSDSTGSETTSAPAASEQNATSPTSRSASFRTPGGDNSIQNFGEEAVAAERVAASAALSGYLRARARGDGAAACRYLARAAVEPLERLAARSPQLEGKDCGELVYAFNAGLPAEARVDTMTGKVDSLRVEGDRGFALYHGLKGTDYFVAMVEEGGKWRVGALSPTEFP